MLPICTPTNQPKYLMRIEGGPTNHRKYITKFAIDILTDNTNINRLKMAKTEEVIACQ